MSALSGTQPQPRMTRRRRFIGREQRGRLCLAVLFLLALCTIGTALTVGASGVSIADLGRSLWHGPAAGLTDGRDRIIFLQLRLPRVLTGFAVGASLAMSGAIMQGLFRNPLADPALTGVSSGASLGAVLVILAGGSHAAWLVVPLGGLGLPLAAFLGGLGAAWLLYRIGTRDGRTSVAMLLLAGIALSTLASAVTGFLIFLADDRQLRDVTFWGMGSLAGASWPKLAMALPVMLPGLLVAPALARGLDALSLGEAAAFHMGIRVQRLKGIAIASVAAASGASVAIGGGIGFVGIIAPHLLRMLIGPAHRMLLPASALMGGILLVAADALARTVVAPAELPIGILTAAAGGPVFLWILQRNHARLAD